MTAKTITIHCESCDSTCEITYKTQEVSGVPETCPFCGDFLGTIVEEEWEEEDDLLDELDEEDYRNWN